jgi:hypothetical protein
MSDGASSVAMQGQSSRSNARSSLPESLDEQQRVDTVLREARLVAHEAVVRTGDHVNCFFWSFLDAWQHSGNTVKHRDPNELRQAGKDWMRDNYLTLLAKGVIDKWKQDYPDLVSAYADQRQAWIHYYNGYTLIGFLPRGTRMRMADEYMCNAVANMYGCTLHVHTKIGPLTYKLFEAAAYCTIHLAYYSASDWQHYRSTRKIISPPASPGPAISALQPAEEGPLSRVISGSANADQQANLHAIMRFEDGFSSQSSQDEGNVSQDHHLQQQPPMRQSVPAILDERLTTRP